MFRQIVCNFSNSYLSHQWVTFLFFDFVFFFKTFDFLNFVKDSENFSISSKSVVSEKKLEFSGKVIHQISRVFECWMKYRICLFELLTFIHRSVYQSQSFIFNCSLQFRSCNCRTIQIVHVCDGIFKFIMQFSKISRFDEKNV